MGGDRNYFCRRDCVRVCRLAGRYNCCMCAFAYRFYIRRIYPSGIQKSVQAALDARTVEAEKQAMELKLQESQISIMLSQIQPHFLYNTLNSIYQLCETNPKDNHK